MTTLRLLIAFFVLITAPLFSQDQTLPISAPKKPAAGVANSIERFRNTDFMLKFNDLKRQVEGDAQDFLAHRNLYKTQDIRKVQLAYERTAGRFNQVMLDIKQDFMDKNKVKMINQYPQMYSDGLTSKINDLDRFYRENLQLALTTVSEKDGSAILAILIELIKASGELSGYFKNIRYEKQAMSEDYINKNLIEPTRLTTWQDILSNTPISTEDTNAGRKKDDTQTGNDDNANNNNGSGNGNNGNGSNNNVNKFPSKDINKEEKIDLDDSTTIQPNQSIKAKKTIKPITPKKNNEN